MQGALDRLLAVERALDDARFAEGLLRHRIDVDSWRGPARDAFDSAWNDLPGLLRCATAALERECVRARMAVAAGG